MGKWYEVLLYNNLDHRYPHLRPTILYANLLAGDLKAATGESLTDHFRKACFASRSNGASNCCTKGGRMATRSF